MMSAHAGESSGIVVSALCIAAAYLLGSIPFGYILVRASRGGDVRKTGSGNIGAANVTRTAGLAAGFATLILDAAKGAAGVWLAAHFVGSTTVIILAGLAAMIGHSFPFWLGFRGGKGVATAAGVFAVVCWPAVLGAIVLWVVVMAFWQYISLASVSAAAALPLLVYVLYAPRHAPPLAISVGTLLAAVLVIVRHRGNIERLIAGTEPRFERPRKSP